MPNELQIKTFPTDQVANQAALQLQELLEANQDQTVLLLVSGGSCLQIFGLLNFQKFNSNLTVISLDERFSNDPKINNYLQMQNSAAMQGIKTVSLIDTVPEPGENKEQLADRYENSLRTWKELNPQGKIFALVGMGADGHSAGMMPFPEAPDKFGQLFCADHWVTSYNAGTKNPYPNRITTTITFFKLIDEAIGYVVGAEKKSALVDLSTKSKPVATLPAMGLYEMGKVTIFTDQKT